MTLLADEADARAWIATLPGVSRETLERLDAFAALLTEENARQNLVAASTLGPALWGRHIADSAQLLPLAPTIGGRWADLGSGPGLPGLVIAILAPHWHMTLVESRRLRCDFLRAAVSKLGLEAQVTVAQQRVEAHREGRYDVISARAFAPLPALLATATHLSRQSTIWLLPKGKNAVNELSTLPQAWQKLFHVELSRTDSDARILVGSGSFA